MERCFFISKVSFQICWKVLTFFFFIVKNHSDDYWLATWMTVMNLSIYQQGYWKVDKSILDLSWKAGKKCEDSLSSLFACPSVTGNIGLTQGNSFNLLPPNICFPPQYSSS